MEAVSYWKSNTVDDGFYCLYVHIPYCTERCNYCIYNESFPHPEPDAIADYVDNLKKEIAFFGDKLDIEFKTLYIGGGTPSVLSAYQIGEILSAINQKFRISSLGMRSFEINPNTCSKEKLHALKEHGINRVSFGIQSMDERVLKAANRGYQKEGEVREAIAEAKRIGFKQINVDLIVGMKGSGKKDILMSFEEVCGLRPTRITIYPLQPTQKFLRETETNKKRHYEKVGGLLDEIKRPVKEIAEKNGYLVPKPPDYNETLNAWRICNRKHFDFKYHYYQTNPDQKAVLGLGSFSRSYIRSVISYKNDGLSFGPRKMIYSIDRTAG